MIDTKLKPSVVFCSEMFRNNPFLILLMDNGLLISDRRISLPRIGNLMCDNCGHRMYGNNITGSYNSFNDYDNEIRHRPHSVYADDSNYVRFSFRVRWQQNYKYFSSKLGEPYCYVTLEIPRSWSLKVILKHIIKIIIINQIQHHWQETPPAQKILLI